MESMTLHYLLLGLLLVAVIRTFAQQRVYKMIHEYAKLAYVDNQSLPHVDFVFYKMNRTTGALNTTFVLAKEITNSAGNKIEVFGLQFRSNEYRMGPIRFDLPLCKCLRSTAFDVVNMLKFSNITQCPIRKGAHFVNKISPDATNFPPLIPEGKWMVRLNFLLMNKVIATVEWYVRVEYPIKF